MLLLYFYNKWSKHISLLKKKWYFNVLKVYVKIFKYFVVLTRYFSDRFRSVFGRVDAFTFSFLFLLWKQKKRVNVKKAK